MSQKRTIKAIAKRETTRDRKARDEARKNNITLDSFVNFQQKMGMGADNALTTSGYGFNPITKIRTMLEWIHRGSWLGGMAIDVVADDMTRMGVDLQGEMSPENLERIEERAVAYGIWNAINDLIKWARLYGGAIAVMMVDGQKPDTPLRIETIGKDQFKGLLILDRWMVEPSMNDLITEPGANLGLPKFYTVTSDAPALPRMRIHHSRVIRQIGIKLPYWQAVQEQLWGISVLERLYDRMVAFDSATMGAAQLVYKAYIRTYSVEGLREVISAGGPPLDGLTRYVEMMRRFQNIEGITLLDGKDKMEAMQTNAFSGLSDVMLQMGQQLSGALQIPLVRLFGQSPAGLNSTGESDLRMYYDGIKQRQEKDLRVGITSVYRALAQSEGVNLKRGYRVDFRSLWLLKDDEKATIAKTVVEAISSAEDSGLISQRVAMKELQQSSKTTGIFSNITDADVAAAEETLPPAGEEAINLMGEIKQPNGGENEPQLDPTAGEQQPPKEGGKEE